MDLLDTAWCPVCDRQIPPQILTALPPPKAAPVPGPQPIKTRGGTIKAPAGSSRRAVGHARSKSSAQFSEPPSQPPSPPPESKKSAKPKTYISQAPTPLYCSPECELADSIGHRLTVSIPSPPSPPSFSHSHSRLHPPASPIYVSGSSSSSDAGGSWGSPFSGNSDYFAYIEGRPRRQSNATNTGSSAESLSSLSQAVAAGVTATASRPAFTRAATSQTATAARSRRPSSSSSLAPRPGTMYAASPPRPGMQQAYTLSFTRAPSSTCSPGSSPPVVSRVHSSTGRTSRDRSSSRASSTLRSGPAQPPLEPSSSSSSSVRSMVVTPTPHQMRPSHSRRASHHPDLPQQPEHEDENKEKQWWSWDRLPHYVPTYEAMSPAKEGMASPERKRMFYFPQ